MNKYDKIRILNSQIISKNITVFGKEGSTGYLSVRQAQTNLKPRCEC